MIVLIGTILNMIGATLMVRGHPYFAHWMFLVADPILAYRCYKVGEMEMVGLFLFYIFIALAGIWFYHKKKIVKDII